MKLIMKSADNKEIIYIPNESYDVGTVESLAETLIIDVSSIEKKYRDYFDDFIESGKTDLFNFIKEDDEFILETPDFYYVFENKLDIMIKENLDRFLNLDLAIGYGEECEGGKYWNIFFVGNINNGN